MTRELTCIVCPKGCQLKVELENGEVICALPDVKNAVWVSPKLVAEVEYAEITKDARLRQPRFIGLRSDKDAKNVVLEEK